MIVPKPVSDPNEQRAIFAEVKNLLEQANGLGHTLDTLLMGMTDDLEQAVAEGATHVRIGTALFGPPSAKAADVNLGLSVYRIRNLVVVKGSISKERLT